MRSRLYVSDPMWLYRSGRQSIMLSQNVESPSSSSPSVSCEESPPSLDVADLHSPSDSSIDETDRFASPYRYSCREEVPYSRAPTEVSMEYNYPRGNGAYLTSAQEQSYRRSSCRFQGALPDGSTEYQNSRWRNLLACSNISANSIWQTLEGQVWLSIVGRFLYIGLVWQWLQLKKNQRWRSL